ncbi:MAG: LPS export ABC transporter periplasmic protein LptC [Saprospiraceae bacterium]|nr:LPS export ABC transporter periplasmic protein LptC [Saprospiraceae bacterium]
MKRLWKYVLSWSVVVLVFLVIGCKKESIVTEEVIYTPEDVYIERMKDVEILYSDSAKVQIKITAPTLLRYLNQNTKQEFSDGLLVEFFDANQRTTGRLSAKYGERIEGDYKIVVRDSVVWQSAQGDQLDTEELTWDERSKMIFTNKFVTITSPDEIIFGYGFEADQDFKRFTVKAVEGNIKVDEFKTLQ